ncbi:MAG: arginase family protein [Candidatus Aenigmatarchaeota archaeon]
MLYASNTFVPYNYSLKEADVVFLGIPFASTSISSQSIYGPVMGRESLKLIEDFIDGKNLFDKIKVCDLGDLEVVPGSYELTAKRIKETISDILDANKSAFPIFVGGEHSITLPIVEAMRPKTIIHLDAHADIRKDYLENKYSHQSWAYHASKIAKLVQIGVTTHNKEELEFIKKSRIQNFTPEQFMKSKLTFQRPVHLTIDVDVFSPQYVETGLPEGAMTPKEIFKILGKISCDSLDIVEIADNRLPSKSGFLAAEIIKRVLARR